MLKINVSISIDLNLFKVNIVVKIYGVKIVRFNINLLGLYYTVNSSKKIKRISLVISEKEKYLIKQIKKSILDKLYYDNFDIRFDVNLGSADLTADLVGVLTILCQELNFIFNIRNKTYDLTYIIQGGFVEDVNNITMSTRVYFTVFDLLFAFVMSFYKRGKCVEEK